MEEIIERQDEAEEIRKFESFKIETASRKVLRELLEAFTLRDDKNHQSIKKLKDVVSVNNQKLAEFDSNLRKIKQVMLDTDSFDRRLSKLVSYQNIFKLIRNLLSMFN